MADVPKLLGQQAPSATTLTDLYTTPPNLTAVVSSAMICNRGPLATTFRLSVAKGGVADAANQYLYYDLTVPPNDTFAATLGVTLGAGDVVRCYGTLASLAFSLFGIESDGNPTPGGDMRQVWIFNN